jgi:ribosome-associated translation inhibitor RaiA
MKLPVQIQFIGTAVSEPLETLAREQVRKLETLFPDLVACRLTISLDQKHKHHGRPFRVHIALTLSGQELVVSKVSDEDAYVALRGAFATMRRQLENVVHRRQGQKRAPPPPLYRPVVRIDDRDGSRFIRIPSRGEFSFRHGDVDIGPG